MRFLHRSILCVAALIALPAVTAIAQQSNNIPGGAFPLPADGSFLTDYVNGSAATTNKNHWYVTRLKGGRTYSIQARPYYVNNGGACTSGFVGLNFYGPDGTTVVSGGNFTGDANAAYRIGALGSLCNSYQGSWRYTYTPTAAANADEYLFVQTYAYYLAAAADYVYYAISVTDTTLNSPWYYTDANYEAYTQVQNTTSQNVTFTVTWYSFVATSGGTTSPLGSSTFTLPPWGSTFIAAKSTTGIAAGSYGGIKLTHNGPPGAIRANATCVNNSGVGLTHSFNIAFTGINDEGGLK
jgi:hypothetical protein